MFLSTPVTFSRRSLVSQLGCIMEAVTIHSNCVLPVFKHVVELKRSTTPKLVLAHHVAYLLFGHSRSNLLDMWEDHINQPEKEGFPQLKMHSMGTAGDKHYLMMSTYENSKAKVGQNEISLPYPETVRYATVPDLVKWLKLIVQYHGLDVPVKRDACSMLYKLGNLNDVELWKEHYNDLCVKFDIPILPTSDTTFGDALSFLDAVIDPQSAEYPRIKEYVYRKCYTLIPMFGLRVYPLTLQVCEPKRESKRVVPESAHANQRPTSAIQKNSNARRKKPKASEDGGIISRSGSRGYKVQHDGQTLFVSRNVMKWIKSLRTYYDLFNPATDKYYNVYKSGTRYFFSVRINDKINNTGRANTSKYRSEEKYTNSMAAAIAQFEFVKELQGLQEGTNSD